MMVCVCLCVVIVPSPTPPSTNLYLGHESADHISETRSSSVCVLLLIIVIIDINIAMPRFGITGGKLNSRSRRGDRKTEENDKIEGHEEQREEKINKTK